MRGGRRWRRFLTLSGAYAYPGTPSTEILEYVQKNPVARERKIHSHWSSNEKTAVEEALGMSYCGLRAITSMKHVGVNVAAPQAALEKSMSCFRWKDHPACFVCWWLLSTASMQVVALKCFDCMIWPEGIRWNTIQESAGAVFCWHSR